MRISKYDLPFRKSYKPQFTNEVFEIVAITTRKPPTYTYKDEKGEIIQGKLYRKELIKVIKQWIRLQIELVSNASGELFPNITLSSFTNFLPEQVNLEGQWEVAISETSYPSMYQNLTEGKFKFFDQKLSKSTSTYNLEPGLYTSITDIVEAMNMIIQERNNHNETCITVKVSRKTQKIVILLANDTSGLASCSTDLGHIFGNNVGNEFGVLMIGKGPHEPEFAYDIVRIDSLMIYSDLVEYSSVGDTKAPLLRCFPIISKLKEGDIITTGQYMNYQTFSNLQFRPLLKNSFHSVHIDLRDTSGEKNHLYLSVSLALF